MKLTNIIAERPRKTVYRDGDKTVKVFDESYEPSVILNEALNLARVGEADTPLHVPKLEEVTKIDGKWAIIYDYIEGKPLSHVMAEHPDLFNEYLNFFVDLQMLIHAQRVPLLSKLKDKMNRKISQSDLDATLRFELHTRLNGTPRHNKLCHGDFTTANVIITPDGTPYILDWGHATQGNASADVARTYLTYCLRGHEAEAELYLNLFCEKSGTDYQYVKRWLPIVAASQSVKNRPEEREMLMRFVDVVEGE